MTPPFQSATIASVPERVRPVRPPLAGLRLAVVALCGLALTTAASASLAFSMGQARASRYPVPHIAFAQGDSTTGQVGKPIALQVTENAGSQLALAWDFGDGTSTSGRAAAQVSHTYDTYNHYRVTVTAHDPIGQTATAQIAVIVNPTPPVASFSTQILQYYYEDCVILDGATSTGTQLTYQWTYGDGNTSGQTQSDQEEPCYSSPGTYTITLTVTDVAGQTNSVTHAITI